MTMMLLRVAKFNTYASFTEMTINKAIGEAASRLIYNQTTQMNQLAKEMVQLQQLQCFQLLVQQL